MCKPGCSNSKALRSHRGGTAPAAVIVETTSTATNMTLPVESRSPIQAPRAQDGQMIVGGGEDDSFSSPRQDNGFSPPPSGRTSPAPSTSSTASTASLSSSSSSSSSSSTRRLSRAPKKSRVNSSSKGKNGLAGQQKAGQTHQQRTKKQHKPGAGGKNSSTSTPNEGDMYFSLDCEMVGVGDGSQSAVARVTIVNWDNEVVLDTFVQVLEPIVDYRTHVSGVKPEDVSSKTAMSVEECRSAVLAILNGKILVGHGLQNDLEVLKISHPWYDIRDTSTYPPFMREGVAVDDSGRKETILMPKKLRDLAWEKLGKIIQMNGQAHSPIEDAITALDLYKSVRGIWETEMKELVEEAREMEAAARQIRIKSQKLVAERVMQRQRQYQELHSAPAAITGLGAIHLHLHSSAMSSHNMSSLYGGRTQKRSSKSSFLTPVPPPAFLRPLPSPYPGHILHPNGPPREMAPQQHTPKYEIGTLATQQHYEMQKHLLSMQQQQQLRGSSAPQPLLHSRHRQQQFAVNIQHQHRVYQSRSHGVTEPRMLSNYYGMPLEMHV